MIYKEKAVYLANNFQLIFLQIKWNQSSFKNEIIVKHNLSLEPTVNLFIWLNKSQNQTSKVFDSKIDILPNKVFIEWKLYITIDLWGPWCAMGRVIPHNLSINHFGQHLAVFSDKQQRRLHKKLKWTNLR